MPFEAFKKFLTKAYEWGSSDVHIRQGAAVRARICGILKEEKELSFDSSLLPKILPSFLNQANKQEFLENKFTQGMLEISPSLRARFHLSKDRGKLFLNCRIIPRTLKTWQDMGVPALALQFLEKKYGMILISSPFGGGKTTTLASFSQYLSEKRNDHLIWVDELIEHKIRSINSIVSLRQLGKDTKNCETALRYALREDPDIIVLGNISDYETAEISLTIAETGHLMIAGVSTLGALNTMMRVLNCFPAGQYESARMRMASYLIGIISQIMVPSQSSSSRVPLFEVVSVTPSFANNMRMDRMNQIKAEFSRSVKGVSITFADALRDLQARGIASSSFQL